MATPQTEEKAVQVVNAEKEITKIISGLESSTGLVIESITFTSRGSESKYASIASK